MSDLRRDPDRIFVVVEGAVGVGKTTVATHVAETLGAEYFHLLPEFLRFRAEVRLDERVAPIPRLAYYLAAFAELSEAVTACLADRSVVCDRYLPTPLSMMRAEGVLSLGEIERMAGPILPHLLRPDLTVLVTAEHAVAVERARSRVRAPETVTVVHRRAAESAEFHDRWQAALRQEAARLGPTSELDTSRQTVEQTLGAADALVSEAVRRRSGGPSAPRLRRSAPG